MFAKIKISFLLRNNLEIINFARPMLTTNKAIVLNKTKYGDRRILVSMFTREYGMTSFSVASATGRRGNSRMNCLQPLSVVEVEYDRKPLVRIQAIRDIRLCFPRTSIPFDPYKMTISLFLSEFVRFAIRKEQRNEPLFDLIVAGINTLDKAEKHYANFHIVFMAELLKETGFYPNTDNYFPGAWFDIAEGCFCAVPPSGGICIKPAQAAVIPVLSRLTFRTMHLLKMSRAQRNECTEMILKYYRCHLPDFPELRSFEVLKELFD